MATLDKLLIYGIRSFSSNENEMQKITFTSPLNLFLGQNGCGKTTIIEALKFAISGDLPGGSQSGQGFVNDPQMSGRSSTKGHVRLSLIDKKDNKYTISKTLQVSQKPKGGLMFKRLESVIKVEKPNGIETAVSSRCIEVDTNCLQIMGVSASILNNVIFCHQENSTWPLEEGKKLKEKFDEIFDAVKYNKCIEFMRKLLKGKQQLLQTLSVEVNYKKKKSVEVQEERSRLQEKERKMDSISTNIEKKQEELQPILRRLGEISDLLMSIGNLQEKLAVMETKHKSLEDQKRSITKNIKSHFDGSDQELRNEIKNSEKNRQNITHHIDDLERKLNDIKKNEKQLNSAIEKMQYEIGLLSEEKNQFKNTCVSRNDLIMQLKDELSLPHSYNLDENEAVQRAIFDIKKYLKESENSLKSLSKEHEAEEHDLQAKIDKFRIKVAEMKQNIKLKNERLVESKRKVRNIESQLRELDVSDDKLKNICNKIKKLDEDLNRLNMSLNVDDLKKTMQDDDQLKGELERQLDKLEKEYKILQQNSITQAELERTLEDISKRESEVYKLKNNNYDDFNFIFKGEVPEKNIKLALVKEQQLRFSDVSTITRKISAKEKVCTTVQTQLNFKKDELSKATAELNSNREQMADVCRERSFGDFLSETYNKIEKLQKEKGQFSSAKFIYEKYIEDFQKNQPCPVCSSNIKNADIVREIIKKLKIKIQGIPTELKRVEQGLKEQQDLYSKLLQLKPVNENIETLASQRIPKLEKEVKDMTTTLERNSEELRLLQENLKEPQKRVDVCNKILADATLIDQYSCDIDKYRDSVERLQQQLLHVPSSRSKQETEILIDDKKLDMKNLQQKCNNNQKRLEQHNNRCHDLREQRSKLVEQQLNIQKAMQDKPQLQQQLEECKQTNIDLDYEIKKMELDLIPLESHLEESIEMKTTTLRKNKESYRQAENKHASISKKIDEITKKQEKIEKFISSDVTGKIDRAIADLQVKKKEKGVLDKTSGEVLEDISNSKTQLGNWDGTVRNLQDNLELREKKLQQKSLEREIEDLRKQIGSSDSGALLNEKTDYLKRHDLVNREINGLNGQRTELELYINEKRADLEKPDNKNAFSDYKHTLGKHRMTEKVCKDIKKYMHSLERALMDFHSERMAQINKRTRELWRTIYRGNDVDYIKIKTEQPTGEVDKRRVYNYKVMQIKRGVELEMRGRCSAGQKVLACLIIRMALAETFSKHCGILALDEPTTNLDKENIISLSQSLARIVRSRQREKNFQLLIITHDEEFLEALKQVEGISHYWNVSRNNDGFSVVSKQRM